MSDKKPKACPWNDFKPCIKEDCVAWKKYHSNTFVGGDDIHNQYEYKVWWECSRK
jgi:hypothetical protein